MPQTFDQVGFIMAYEDGQLDELQIEEGFQHLIDNGTVWKLQGSYGRMAERLIVLGHCQDTHNVVPRTLRERELLPPRQEEPIAS